MATDLDELQIVITSNSKEAADAIDKLVKGLEGLNTALGNLDASKISSFSSAMSKLANIGANTNTTAKTIKSLSQDLSQSFNIKTKKGVEDITIAIQALYSAARNLDLNDSLENGQVYLNSIKNLEKAIEANYQYKQAVDSTTQSIAEYIKIQNQSGRKVAMGEMAEEYGEDFKNLSKVLGKSFKNSLKSTEGAQDLAEFFNDMNSALNTDFKTGSLAELKESVEQLRVILENSKGSVYKFSDAIAAGLLNGEEAAKSAQNIADKLFSLIKEQDKYGASSGLSSIAMVFNEISQVQMPDFSQMADALKYMQSASDNLAKSAPSIDSVKQAMDNVAASVEKATGDVNELSTALVVVSKGYLANIDLNTALQPIAQASTALKGLSDFQPPDLSTGIEYFNEYEQAIRKAIAALNDFNQHQKALTDDIPIETTGEWVSDLPDKFTAVSKATDGARRSASDFSDSVKRLTDDIPIDTTGEWVEDLGRVSSALDRNIKLIEEKQKAVRKEPGEDLLSQYPKKVGKPAESPEIEPTSLAEISEKLITIGEGFERLSETFGSFAEKGIKLFEFLVKPLEKASEEYVEKFRNMTGAVANFQKNFKAHMKKVSDFWKRTMRTFTFMIVRKAFTAILKEVGTAVQSLALYSNAMGTAFNTDLSNMVADFQYLGRSIVSVFAPLLNFIAPIIDAITSRIATLLSYIGMLFTALGGGTSFTKAKKNVGNYAESLDKANKSAKNLTMGIDELNILNEKSSGSAKPYDGWEDAWEDVEIPDWINDLADKLKNIFKDLFEPMKRAWNLAKDYVLDGWKFMTKNMKKLLQDVWRDFIRVWKGDTVTHIFYNLLMILGDIERVIGFIAKRFDEAWNEGEKGYKILSNIASIVDILVQHLRNVTLYMVGWASRLDFNPLLESFEYLTRSLTDLAEFVGQVFEDIMKRVVLKYLNFLIEEGLPHLQHTIAETLTYFDFGAIREKLRPIEDAFEELLENLDIGKTEAIGNLGRMIAEFTDSEDFQNFLNTIQHMMEVIDAETVEKILTGIGMGIGNIADALVKFVGSETFNAFIDSLDEWLDNASAEDIAGILERLAGAIAMFKFAEFASAGLANFFTFAGLLKSFKDIGTISQNLGEIGTKLGAIGVGGTAAGAGEAAAADGLAAVATPASTVAIVITAVVAGVYSLIESFGGLDGFLTRIREGFARVKEFAAILSKEVFGLRDANENLKDAFSRLGKKLGGLTSLWDALLYIVEIVADAFVALVIPVLTAVESAITLVIDAVSTLVDVLGGLADVIFGTFTFDSDKVTQGWDKVVGSVDDFGETVVKHVKNVFNGSSDAAEEEAASGAKRVAGAYAQNYSTEIQSLEGLMKDSNTTAITNAALNTDLTSASDLFANQSMASLTSSVASSDYSGLSDTFSGIFSNSILEGQGIFDEANAETAASGAETFNSEYVNAFSSSSDMNDAMTKLGQESVAAFNTGMETELSSQSIGKTVQEIFKQINESSKACIETLKGNLATNIGVMISTLDFMTSFTTLFNRITETVTTNVNTLGENLGSTVLPAFMETYIAPLFSAETWQPYFDTLLNDVFMTSFETFRTWFTEQAVTPFWEDDVVVWFEKDTWDKDAFTPLEDNIHSHWDTFLNWWDESMKTWWDKHVVVWFEETKWTTQFEVILTVAKKVFEAVRIAIKEEMDAAQEAVSAACEAMAASLADIITAISEMMTALEGFEGFEGKVTFDFGSPTGYATGGFPQEGTLFYAGERGAEFVSNVNGRTGVVSNGEITGIADAVYATGNTESELLAQLISIGQAMLNKDPVVIGDKELAMAVDRGKNRMGMTIIT